MAFIIVVPVVLNSCGGSSDRFLADRAESTSRKAEQRAVQPAAGHPEFL
jgi:hypothetical protein